MRNLKRALSLLLAAAMLIGMMVVGASAASSLDDFPDKDEIVNQDAVSLLTILGVIEGTDSGTFNPTGNVTRAEMAKMIATILNQGADVAGLYTGMNTGLTDVSGHWAESYINYCYSLGIIAGRGDGTFDPGADVTGTEAAKMLLVAAGYDPSIEGMEGADWAIRTAALASTLGIFDNLTAPTGDPLNRDNAALLVYNALDIEMIQRYQDGYAIAFADSRTILSTKYGVYRIEGVVASNEWARLEGTGSDAALAEGKTRLTDVLLIDSDTVNTIGNNTDDGFEQPDTTFNVSTPVEYLGQTVTMYVRNTTVLANSEVLGVYLKDGANTVLTSVETESSMSDFLKGTGLSVDAGTEYYVNYGVVASESAATTAMGFTSGGRYTSVASSTNAYGIEMTVIDNDQDGTVDYVLYLQEALSQVTVNDDTDAETALNGFNNNGMIDDADIVTELDLAEGDLVLAVEYGGRYYVSAPEVVTGEMESYRNSRATEQVITVDGTEYHPSYIEYRAESADNTYVFNIAECDDGLDGVQFDTTYDFILDSNGNVIAYQPSEQGLYDYALILESGYEPGAFASDATGKVTALLPDGTESTYTLNFSASAKNVGEQIADLDGAGGDQYSKEQGIRELKGFLGTADSDNSSTAPWRAATTGMTSVFANRNSTPAPENDYRDGRAIGYVVGYSLNDSNVMTITSIVGANVGNAIPAVGEYSDTTVAADGGKDVVDSRLSSDYASGAARIWYNTDRDQLTIDRNTIAFYYDVDTEKYGVAVGYDEMADVDTRTEFVSKTVRNTNLAAVVLYDAEGKQAERDYVYVLDDNRRTDTVADLEVVYEDGTIGIMTIDRENYDDVFTSDSKFGTAYAYKADGDIFEIDDSNLAPTVKEGYAWKLRDGSVALYDANGKFIDSYAYADDTVWNVENASSSLTKAPAASFTVNVGKEVVLVLDTTGDKVKAAFVERTLTNEENPGLVPGDVELPEPIRTLYNPTLASIIEAFDAGYSVYIPGSWTLPFGNALSIPADLGLQTGGDLTLSGTLNNYGVLIADGTLTTSSNSSSLSGSVQAGVLNLTANTTVDGNVTVTGNVTGNGSLTVNSGHSLYVGGNTNATVTPVNVSGQLQVVGHVNGDLDVKTGGRAVVNGNVVGKASVNGGTAEISGRVTNAELNGGTMTVGTLDGALSHNSGALNVTGNMDVSTANTNIVVDSTRDLTVGGTLNNGTGTVDVLNGKTLSAGALTTSGAVTLNDGTLDVDNALTTGSTVTATNGDIVAGSMTASGGISMTNGALKVTGNVTLNSGANLGMTNTTAEIGGDVINTGAGITVMGTDAELIVTGRITGTTSSEYLNVNGGSATVGGVGYVHDVASGAELTVLGNIGEINTNNGVITVTGTITTGPASNNGVINTPNGVIVSAGASVSDINNALASATEGTVISLPTNLTAGAYEIPTGVELSVSGNVPTGTTFTGGGILSATGTVNDSSQVATQVTLPSNGGSLNLSAPNVVIGTVDGTIGQGTEQFSANDLDGEALYQFDIGSAFVSGNTSLLKRNGTWSALATSDDLWIGMEPGETRVISISNDGNTSNGAEYTVTVTAPNF